MKSLSYFDALPPYPGGKRKLNPWIFNKLNTIIPQNEWTNLTFVDAFSGGGAVSLHAKLMGFGHLISNDLSDRSHLVLQGLIANSHSKLSLSTVFPLMGQREPGFVCEHFAGSVFSQRHALALDSALQFIQTIQDPTQKALLRLLLWKRVVKFVAFGTSIGTSNRPFAEALDGKRSFSTLNPKRLRDGSLAHLLEPSWKGLERDMAVLNQSIFPATGKIQIYQTDVFELLPKIQGDILYVDPPYANTLGYSKANEVLDAVLFEHIPERRSESVFTKRVEAISEMLDLARKIPIWLLSYNDKVVDLEALAALIKAVDPSRSVQTFGQTYAHLPHVAKRQNQELLIIATKGSI